MQHNILLVYYKLQDHSLIINKIHSDIYI